MHPARADRPGRIRVRLLWAAAVVLLLAASLTVADPALVLFALDPELAAVIVISGLALLRTTPAGAMIRGTGAFLVRAAAAAPARVAGLLARAARAVRRAE